ncbi:MAG: polyphosphate kinase 1 [Candidatus Methylacidiphilales bacterium]|nr:polyphosphate kinase 1 [Candidatus Methylacidiphilales bacterium]
MQDPVETFRPEHFVNRELSWLEFNQRVLEEALDPTTPLLERVKFLGIVSSNLDEFFEIRIAGLKQQIDSQTDDSGPDGLTANQALAALQRRVNQMVRDQYHLWRAGLVPALAEKNIRFLKLAELDPDDREWARRYFINEVYPVLTPLAVDPSHPFPQLLNKSLNLIVVLEKGPKDAENRHAIVQIPRVLSRLIELPNRTGHTHEFLFLGHLIEAHVEYLFPGMRVLGTHPFRVTRNSDLYIDEEESQNLLSHIEEELRKRNRGNAVRLEVEDSCPTAVRQILLEKFRLQKEDLYAVNGPLNMMRLMTLSTLDAPKELKYPNHNPVTLLPLQGDADIFEVMRTQDLLFHHPYENFQSIVEFVEKAASDPRVLAIKMTLYRTSGDSPIIKALIRASEEGKQITVLVELKARFDEANNIAWARAMEEAGIHVVYGLVGLKTHCKILMIVRRDEDRIRHYVHLGTGNYHPRTARLYTDLGLLTTRESLCSEVATLFNTLTGMSDYPGFEHLMVAPFDLRERFIEKIARETAHARAGRPASIFAKMNALVDRDIIESLYQASQAGVKIDLLIRGICCLRPGLPGVSENIEVRSIVDQFLEHSRVYIFGNDGAPEVYLGSADWMPRNLIRRIEVVFPVLDPLLRQRILDEIVDLMKSDNTKARVMQPDGTYRRPAVTADTPRVRCQAEFILLAEKHNRPAASASKPRSKTTLQT